MIKSASTNKETDVTTPVVKSIAHAAADRHVYAAPDIEKRSCSEYP